ncbi:hypothetical protein ES708_34925 [subsurface metagenome]
MGSGGPYEIGRIDRYVKRGDIEKFRPYVAPYPGVPGKQRGVCFLQPFKARKKGPLRLSFYSPPFYLLRCFLSDSCCLGHLLQLLQLHPLRVRFLGTKGIFEAAERPLLLDRPPKYLLLYRWNRSSVADQSPNHFCASLPLQHPAADDF